MGIKIESWCSAISVSVSVPVVLDSKYLLQNPELILKKLCLSLEIRYDKSMLQWERGGRKEDGVWSRYWYKNVHNSTGFIAYREKEESLLARNRKLARECLPYYEFLTDKSIKL